ncbi:MAG TPA: hypothetical protein VK066_02755 [Chloroflexota bacterium]|nr:hypothetical protein [Chloroflexota bacterium]
MKPIRLLRAAGLVAALALALGTAGGAVAQEGQPGGSSAVPESGDQMATGSQPALPSCAERPNDNSLGPATGPITGYAPGTDAGSGTGPGTTTGGQGPGAGALPVTGPAPATGAGSVPVAPNPEAPPAQIGSAAPAVDNLGATLGPGTAGSGPDASAGPIPATCAEPNNPVTGGTNNNQ